MIRKPDRMFAHDSARISKSFEDEFRIETSQSIDRPEGMDPALRGRSLARQLDQCGDHRLVLPLDQEPLRGSPPPEIWVSQFADEIGRTRLSQARLGKELAAAMNDTVDSPPAFPVAQVELAFHLFGDVIGMLDVLAGVIDHVERAVRPGRGEDRLEPGVGRGQKLGFFDSASRDEGRPLGRKQIAVDQVVDRLA